MGIDPRWFQLTVLSTLVVVGTFRFQLPISVAHLLWSLGAATLTQWALDRWYYQAPRPGSWRSSAISALSLTMLLRVSTPALLAPAAILAIGSKAICSWRGRHFWNPANFALVMMSVGLTSAWVTPGQWGSALTIATMIACAGVVVVTRAARWDVTAAFLGSYGGLLVLRAVWLGDPLAIPLRELQSGSLIIFSFFMISDPKTTPQSRLGRVLFGVLVASLALSIRFTWYVTTAPIFALALAAWVVPLIDWIIEKGGFMQFRRTMQPIAVRGAAVLALMTLLVASKAHAFCGFYVAKADTDLFNSASKVVLARDGDRTVLTMSNDFKGEPKEFAIVIPVPTVLEKGQVHVGEMALIDRIDAFTAPRLVEYFDEDPCNPARMYLEDSMMSARSMGANEAMSRSALKRGVTIEASYTVGEYDILILSAKESDGLGEWLTESGYKLPAGASAVLGSYIKQGLKFFVAKVNLEEHAKGGFTYLRPLQIAYESPRFMLPIRLGTLNAQGDQELFVFGLSRAGRIEASNYRTIPINTDADIPEYIKEKNKFGDFYKALFTEQLRRENGKGVFLEYAWNVASCDPCAADPLSNEELRKLGAFWIDRPADSAQPGGRKPMWWGGGGGDTYVTRLHVRYNATTFPDDLMLQTTGNTDNFQGRYVIRHPWRGDKQNGAVAKNEKQCSQLVAYNAELIERQEREAQTLASLTGWKVEDIRGEMGIVAPSSTEGDKSGKWWESLW